MRRPLLATTSALAALFLGSASPSLIAASVRDTAFAENPLTLTAAVTPPLGVEQPPPQPTLPPPPPPPPTPDEALRDGVLIVVSLASQKAFVFKHGDAWDTTDVSTGKAGNETPEGVFPILQKKVHHRSTLYNDAPMPYMQRLTWDGVALHAGKVPGYPASHGCIRLPKSFAKKLYEITNFSSTVVVVSPEPLATAKEARKLV